MTQGERGAGGSDRRPGPPTAREHVARRRSSGGAGNERPTGRRPAERGKPAKRYPQFRRRRDYSSTPKRDQLRAELDCGPLEWQRGAAWALVQSMGLVWYYRESNPTMAGLGRSTLARLLAAPEL